MTSGRNVIGTEHILGAAQKGMQYVEVMPTDIVTAQALETAERLGIRLENGPMEKPAAVKTSGSTAMRRSLYRRSPRWVSPDVKNNRSSRRLQKLALIGAGGVGANIAQLAVNSDIADQIMLIDVASDMAKSVALDLNHARGISRSRCKVAGSGELASVAGAEIIVVTAGRPRTPGMDRSDLISVNRRVIHSCGEAIRVHAPDAVVIVVTNPLDEMTVEMLRATGFKRNQVLGMAGTLDSSRFRNALAEAANVDAIDVDAITLGSHGNEMAPIISNAKIKGRPLKHFLSEAKIEACVKDAVTGGAQVVALKKMGSATVAPAHASMEVIEHLRGARAGPIPVSVLLNGEFGVNDVVLGVPCHLGRHGLIEVEEISLSEQEQEMLHAAAAAIQERLG